MTALRPFDEVVDFLTSAPQPEAIISFRPSTASQERVNFLLERNSDDALNEVEKQELNQFLIIEHLMRLAKSRARKRLAQNQ